MREGIYGRLIGKIAKDEFRKELRLLEKVRDLEMEMCRDILREKEHKDQKPAKR